VVHDDLANYSMLICVSEGRMPLLEYTVIHRNAKLSKRDINLICGWAAAPSAPSTSLQVSKPKNKKQ
jgi:hypothetical protein